MSWNKTASLAKTALSGHVSYAVGDTLPFDIRDRRIPSHNLRGGQVLSERAHRKELDELEGNRGLARGVIEQLPR